MASAMRAAILGHIRVPVAQALTLNGWRLGFCSTVRSMSSHGDDHLTKNQVADRVLDVVKSFPKVDPSKVTPDVHFQKDLGLDSLDNVEIVMALEEEFKLEIPDKEAIRLLLVAAACEMNKKRKRKIKDGKEKKYTSFCSLETISSVSKLFLF